MIPEDILYQKVLYRVLEHVVIGGDIFGYPSKMVKCATKMLKKYFDNRGNMIDVEYLTQLSELLGVALID